MDSIARSFLPFCALATTALGFDIDPAPANGVPAAFPVGKTLVFPITTSNVSTADALTFKVTSSNPKILVRVKTGNPALRLTVNYGAAQSGEMMFLLFREWTPLTNGFIGGFAQSGFFDNVKFHRVIKNFVIQGGDPLGTGLGGPGMTGNNPSTAFKFENEFQPGLQFTGRGQLAMANSGFASDFSGTNGSQFFVTLEQLHVPSSVHQFSLDFKHTIFGQMVRGWSVLDAIANVPVDGSDKPLADVVITSAKVEPNVHDAVLMISAIGRVLPTAPATITVTADDGHGGVVKKTFTVSTVDDAYNSPPVLQNVPAFTVGEDTEATFALKHFDLEADYLSDNHGVLVGNATDLTSGFTGAIRGNSGFAGQARIAFNISQFNVGQGIFESPIVQSYTLVGIGDRPLRTEPISISGTPGVAFTGVVARFQDTDPAGSVADFTTPASNTTINWGDGTPVQNGTYARDPAVAGPASYAVTGTHTFAKAGTYTIIVTATGNKGAIGLARTQAVISAGTIVAEGADFDVKGPAATNRILATFTDSNAPGAISAYTATVDWGDGQSSKGVISRRADKSYLVRGSHVYKDAEPFAVSVRIEKAGATDAFAWSTANVSGFAPAPHLGPFPVVHLIGAWNSGPSKRITAGLTGSTIVAGALAETFAGRFVVINSGTRTSSLSTLRFFLSRAPLNIASFAAGGPTVIATSAPHGLANGDEIIISGVAGGSFTSSINGSFVATVIDATHFSVSVTCSNASVTTPGTVFSRTAALSGATQLTVNSLPEVTISGFAGGVGGEGSFTINLPAAPAPPTGIGRYLLSQLVYSDPIIDASKVDKVVVTGPISGVYAYGISSQLGVDGQGEYATDESGKFTTFNVVLDTAPTANVSVGIVSSLPAEGAVDKATLTFTPANWNLAQTVKVTGVADNVKDGNKAYTVTIASPVSTDPRYSGTSGLQIPFINIDKN